MKDMEEAVVRLSEPVQGVDCRAAAEASRAAGQKRRYEGRPAVPFAGWWQVEWLRWYRMHIGVGWR
jgi:hypothetical protein